MDPRDRQFAGMWRLRSFEQLSPNGVTYPFGKDVSGLIVYDPSGLMSVQLARSPMPRFSNSDSEPGDPFKEPVYSGEAAGSGLNELERVFDSYLAYFGSYTLNWADQTVTHHVEGSNRPSFVNRKLVRAFDFSGDLLSLSPPAPDPVSVVLVWQRI